mmetsp:Transcript_19564/g.24669  ORF Transcript_19564/g.24669 Transcript_19564/m.24669 type:complete len:242 (-) Transcript_19564:1312-2037(-)|eukprot:CAMPEP_0203644126 /NCGR_PEP_ID=MMETSP0088-20131115/9551_1 /ASSEMBLY_ACC=CAM_ASM_001087 /TAXON_ID=426623 /ORGANISM="Chaetoceros affinis, Strain CCMP159" /LENGTH=241 /DNA_ID=CAMNT_0050500527 /DNA_START=231 /DNA_END=956 /DNA_ORIENTATION=-
MEESTAVTYNFNVPYIQIEERTTIPLPLSPEDSGPKVSFEDDPYCMLGCSPTTLNSNFALSMLKEQSRVVSNDIIYSATELKSTKSKSLPSLTRSGDLKSLLESTLIGIPAVSEDSLSSDSHEEETIRQPQNDSWAQRTENLSDHTSCTGWGQFVDFLPLQAIGESTQGKQVCPIRKRSSSFCTSSRYRNYSKSRANHSKYLEQRKTRQGTSSPMYNRKMSTGSTNEMAEAFRIQLSLATK